MRGPAEKCLHWAADRVEYMFYGSSAYNPLPARDLPGSIDAAAAPL